MKSLSTYKVGDIYEGENITKIFSAKDDYIIFEGNSSGIVTIGTSSTDRREAVSKINSQITIISEHLKSEEDRQLFVDQIGLAYSEAIENNLQGALEVCDAIIVRIKRLKQRREMGNFYYLASCLGFVLSIGLIAVILKVSELETAVIPQYHFMAYAAIGGFLSVARTSNKIYISSEDFGWYQAFYGFVRIIIAMFSGLIVYVAIQSELVLSQIDKEENFYIIALLAIAAGFSESLIPNLLEQSEGHTQIVVKDSV